jgi:hypothetical protein
MFRNVSTLHSMIRNSSPHSRLSYSREIWFSTFKALHHQVVLWWRKSHTQSNKLTTPAVKSEPKRPSSAKEIKVQPRPPYFSYAIQPPSTSPFTDLLCYRAPTEMVTFLVGESEEPFLVHKGFYNLSYRSITLTCPQSLLATTRRS